MNGLLTLLGIALGASVIVVTGSEGGAAILVCLILTGVAMPLISRANFDRRFLLRLFVGGLLVRVLVATIIFLFHLQDFFGGDALTYDFFGYALLRGWQGEQYYQSLANMFVGVQGTSAWGMLYLVAVVYRVIGRNPLAIQLVNSVLGAATAPIITLCAQRIYGNFRVSRIAGLFCAFYPSLVLWSSQGLKDGPIVFLLALSVFTAFSLAERLSVKYLVLLVLCLFGLMSLRFYIFYMMSAAIAGAFIIGMRSVTATSFVRQFIVIIFVGVALSYMGVTRYANVQVERYSNLETLQNSRVDMAYRGQSGFGRDVDVSTTSGALSAIPLGLLYLLFAPFPWQLGSLRQSITLPEMVVWWASFPLLILGLWFTIKYRLRQAIPILSFTTMLTLAYSMFQGNVGTAYRQRAQLLVFYFIFIAAGYILLKERQEERRLHGQVEREAFHTQRARLGP